MKINKIFSVFLLLIGSSAVLGSANLIFKNGGGMPLEWLASTPFSTYFWPGIILAFVVGGTYLVAALVTWMKYRFAAEFAAVAGFGLLIWIFTEIYMISFSHWLQALYFGLGIITILISMAEFKFQKRD